jgi:hypothetical protein
MMFWHLLARSNLLSKVNYLVGKSFSELGNPGDCAARIFPFFWFFTFEEIAQNLSGIWANLVHPQGSNMRE